MKKAFVYVALVLALVFALTACGPKTTTPDDKADDVVVDDTTDADDTVDDDVADDDGDDDVADDVGAEDLDPYEIVYYMYSTKASDQSSVIAEALNEIIEPKFNATIDFVMVSGGDWDEKAKVALNAGEKIDIFWTPEWMGYMDNISAGVLLPLDDADGPYGDLMAQYAPDTIVDLGDFIEANIVDGYLYGVATNKELCVPGGLVWNEALTEKYDIDTTKVLTVEDLEPILYEFKDSEEYAGGMFPLLSTGGWSAFDPHIQGFMADMGSITMYIGEPGATDGVPLNQWTDDDPMAGRARREIMAKWMSDGLLHPDSDLDSFSDIDYLNNGEFLVSTNFVLKGGQVKAKELMGQSGNPDLRLVEQQTSASVNVTTHAGGSMLGIPITSEDPARAMMFINEMHQNEELLNLMAWGIEGTHYDLNDDGFVVPRAANGWSDSHGGMWTLGNQFKQMLSEGEDPLKYDQMMELTAESWGHESLGFRFNRDSVAAEFTAISNVMKEWESALNVGKKVDEYDTFLQALEESGIETVLEEAKTQYADWKASK